MSDTVSGIGSKKWVEEKRKGIEELKKEKLNIEQKLLISNPDWRDVNSQIVAMERMLE